MSTASRRNQRRRLQLRNYSDLPLDLDSLYPELVGFGQWLLSQSYHPLQLVGRYEAMRWLQNSEVCSVYFNKKREVTWTEPAAKTFRAYLESKQS